MKTFFSLLLCVTLFSCAEYYVSEPQPVDGKNITKIPNKLRGTWVIDQKDDLGRDSIIIGKSYYKKFSIGDMIIGKEELARDTSTYYIGEKIYNSTDEGLEGGYTYRMEGDSMIINTVDLDLVDLGEGAFLRKVDNGYILNEQNDKMYDWWSVRFIDTRSEKGILVRGLRAKDLQLSSKTKPLHEDFEHYIIASWTRQEMDEFIRKGGFSDTLIILKNKDKLK